MTEFKENMQTQAQTESKEKRSKAISWRLWRFQGNVNKRKSKQEASRKLKTLLVLKKRPQNSKYEAKQKAEDPVGFKENVNKRKSKQEAKQKADYPVGFKEKLHKRNSKYEAK